MQYAGLDGSYLPAVTGAVGAGTAWALGGDPMSGFWQGYGIGALNHKGEKYIATDGTEQTILIDDVVVWGYAPYKQKFGQQIYGIWNEQLFRMNKAKTYGPSIDWGGPWEIEFPDRILRDLKWTFTTTQQSYVEKPYIVNSETVHSTVISKDYGPDGLFKNSNNVLYESDYHRQIILRTRGTYIVGDTSSYWLKRTWSNGHRDSIYTIK